MNFDQPKSEAEISEQRNKEIILLATELSESGEIFKYTGIDSKIYSSMSASDLEYPGMTTPIDKIIERCTDEGVKVVFSKDPESSNVYILPAKSTDIENDGIQPQSLLITDQMNDSLKKLIILDKERINAQKASKIL